MNTNFTAEDQLPQARNTCALAPVTFSETDRQNYVALMARPAQAYNYPHAAGYEAAHLDMSA